MKKILFVIIIPFVLYAQTQVRPDWPSLAKTAWPVVRSDMQSTGRSDYIGPRTSIIKWKKDIPLGVFLGPILGFDNNIYAATYSFTYDTTLNKYYCIDTNGNNIWTFQPLRNSIDAGSVIGSDSTLYFDGKDKFYAVNSKGNIKWNIELDHDQAPGTPQMCMAKNGDIYLPLHDTVVIISRTGYIKNKKYVQNITAGLSFSFGGDTLYAVLSNGIIKAFDLSFNELWSFNLFKSYKASPLVDNQNNLYTHGGDSLYNVYLYCLKPDGTLKWKSVNLFYVSDYFTPSMDKKGNIYCGAIKYVGNDGYYFLKSLHHDGTLRWETQLQKWKQNWPSVGITVDAAGKSYLAGTVPGGYLTCVDSNGIVLWDLSLNDYEADSHPVIGSDGSLYLGVHKGSVNINQVQNLLAIKDYPDAINEENIIPDKTLLYQNYPNPFNPVTKINYSIAEAGFVKLRVYNILGKEVAILINEQNQPGNYSVDFNAAVFPSGVYIYKLESGKFSSIKKMTLIK